MSIMMAVREFLKSCPLFQFAEGDKEGEFLLQVDYLEEVPLHYALESVPGEPVIKRYTDGSSVRQFPFVLSARNQFDPGQIRTNMEVLEFYENFADWMEQESRAGNLPVLEGNKRAVSMEASTHPYLMDMDPQTTRYQMQCRLTYLQGV